MENKFLVETKIIASQGDIKNSDSQGDVDEEVDGGVEDDKGVGEVVDDGQPFRPRGRRNLFATLTRTIPSVEK